MFWFLMYCAWSGLFFFVGAKGMSLHWFWNGVFSLLASGTFTYSIHRVVRSKLCPARLRRGINTQKNPKELRSTVEAAFGKTPDLKDPTDAWGAGFFACVPLLVVAYVYLGFVIQSGIWRFLCAFVVGIPLAVFVGKLVNAIAGQKRTLEEVKQVITDHNPQIWKEMTQAWDDRKKAQAKADAAVRARAAKKRREKKELGAGTNMTNKGECPKCGGVMEWKRVDFNPLNFLVFTGNPVIRAWKCEKCGDEIGRTDTTFEKVPPPQGSKTPSAAQASTTTQKVTETQQTPPAKQEEGRKTPSKVQCERCGTQILRTTAVKTGGLCRPCAKKA